MKRYCKRLLSCLFLMGMLVSICNVSVFAIPPVTDSTQDSAYIDSYRAALTAWSGGEIICSVDVNAAVYADKVGASDIYILESTDGTVFHQVWSLHRNYEDYPEMMGVGLHYYEDPYSFYGTIGHYYLANVCIYVEKDGGSDTRLYTTAPVLCHNASS